MSTTTTAPAPAPEQHRDPVVVHEAPRGNIIGLVALGLAILGFLFAVFLVTAGLAWILLIPAIALGVIGLFLPNRRRGAALAGVIIGVMGLVLSFVGFRLPLGSFAGQEVVNNEGVNPFSVFAGPLPGQQVSSNGGTGTGATGENGSGLVVEVSSVDCHAPLASVTGLNITGEVCAITLTATNNGQDLVTIDSSNVSATADGSELLAQVELSEGPLLEAQIGPGQSSTGTVYVNVPDVDASVDGVRVRVGDDDSDIVDVDLGNLGVGLGG